MRKLLGQLADPNVEEHGTGLTPVRAALMPVAKASSAHDEAPGDGVFEDIVALRDNLRQTAGLGNTFDWPDSFLFVYVYCSNDGIGCFRIFIGYVIDRHRMLRMPLTVHKRYWLNRLKKALGTVNMRGR